MARIKNDAAASSDYQAGINLGRAPEELREAGVELDDIEVVAAHDFHSVASEAKFMEEKVVIEVEAADDPNAPVFIYLGHNGVTQYVERGKLQTIKRKFLYSALAAKTVKFASAFGKDSGGNEFNRLNGSAAMTHRVRLVSDNNPQGGARWVQSVMANA